MKSTPFYIASRYLIAKKGSQAVSFITGLAALAMMVAVASMFIIVSVFSGLEDLNKEMIANLRGMPFGVKSLEKRQNDLVGRLFPPSERVGVNATRLVVRALELRILNIDNLEADDE